MNSVENQLPEQSAGSKIIGALINALAFLLLRPKIYKSPELSPDARYIFVCNHTHHFDGVLIAAVLRKFKPYTLVTAKWYEKKNLIGFLVRNQRSIPIELDSEKGSMAWFKSCEHAALKHSLLIFPEGAISRDGIMHEFKSGAGVLSVKTGLPIVPVACCGEYNLLFRKRQRVKIASPIEPCCPENMRTSKYAALMMNDAENRVREMYRELDDEYGGAGTYKEV